MPLRRCLDCQTLTSTGSLCPRCTRRRKQRRNSDRRLAAEVASRATACAICGRPPTIDDPLTMDHTVPVSRGGTSDRSNVRAAHRSCNSRKRDR